MACDCNDRINGLLADKNCKLAFGFEISCDTMSTTTQLFKESIPALIRTEKLNPRGKKPPVVMATFCPFCGIKYET